MAGPFIWSGSYAKSLKDLLNLNDNAYIIQGTADPTSSAQNAPQGSVYLRTGASGGKFYTKQDAGSSTNWTLLSSGASSAVRVINAQSGTTYTFALTDGSGNGNNPLVTFGSASTTTVTVPTNASVAFPVGSQIDIIQDGAGIVSFAAAGGVTINSLNGSLTMQGQYTEASLIKTATNTWDLVGATNQTFIVATGGSISTSGNLKIHTFTTSGTFQITSGFGTVDSLTIAGGGGGGGGSGNGSGGGGGAGGMIYTSPGSIYAAGSYTVTVGAGGTTFTNGSNSVFDVITATGGGAGAHSSGSGIGSNGGSGGGGAIPGGVAQIGGTGIGGQGFGGGSGFTAVGGGGGGGAGAVGANAIVTGSGSGGVGVSNSITGSAVFYGGGGGGGCQSGSAGTGGNGGGGNGSVSNNSTPGAANKGGGGGGGVSDNGSSGGSGVVIVSYRFQ